MHSLHSNVNLCHYNRIVKHCTTAKVLFHVLITRFYYIQSSLILHSQPARQQQSHQLVPFEHSHLKR